METEVWETGIERQKMIEENHGFLTAAVAEENETDPIRHREKAREFTRERERERENEAENEREFKRKREFEIETENGRERIKEF
ncbi:MAG: hypothetical protein ACE5E9_07180, partial [Nitrospinaceae bacterium]